MDVGDLSNAIPHLVEAVRLLPNGYDQQYNSARLNYPLADAYYQSQRYGQCVPILQTVLRYNPKHSRANYLMAMAKAWLGETETTGQYFEAAVRLEPSLGQLPDYYDLLSRNYVTSGLYAQALTVSEKGWQLAVAAGRSDQAGKLQERMQLCRNRQ
jgi:tetratricopeptide (TPR) repeat protein